MNVFGGIPGDGKIGIPGKNVGYMPQVRMKFYIALSYIWLLQPTMAIPCKYMLEKYAISNFNSQAFWDM